MLRPVSTLPLAKNALQELRKSGCHYVQDIQNSEVWAHKYDENILNPLPTTLSALDLWQEEVQQDNLSTLCEDLDGILDGGVQCGSITEISGAYGSGKTQICFQLSVVCYLSEDNGGLNAQSLYIDSRNGFSPGRVRDIIAGCQKRFPEAHLDEAEILKGIRVSSPRSAEELLSIIYCLKRWLRLGSKIRLVVIDSLSLPVQYAFVDGWQRTQFYFKIMDELQDITENNKVAVVVVNELRSNVDAEGQIVYESAGGQIVAHRAHKRLVVARLDDATYAARILKAPCIPQISVKFRIDEDGVKDQSKRLVS